jgi:hypothetical protein
VALTIQIVAKRSLDVGMADEPCVAVTMARRVASR